MRRVLGWIVGIVLVLVLIGLVVYGRSDRQAYRAARGAIEQRVETSQALIDARVDLATKAVDLALVKAGNLPSQQAEADLIKQDIEEIGRRLNEVAEAQGEAAMASLDASIEQFNTTLERVDEASKQAEDPAVKSALDRLYGLLEGVKEQLVQSVLSIQE
jgi:hypothetical protein